MNKADYILEIGDSVELHNGVKGRINGFKYSEMTIRTTNCSENEFYHVQNIKVLNGYQIVEPAKFEFK